MPGLEMDGPFEFHPQVIDELVTRTAPGNYALGHLKEDDEDTFVVCYVGRSDTDLKKELKARLSLGHEAFMFSYATSRKNAFDTECWNYHDFGESRHLENEIHPRRPDGSTWQCPKPGCKAFQK